MLLSAEFPKRYSVISILLKWSGVGERDDKDETLFLQAEVELKGQISLHLIKIGLVWI